MLAVLKWFELCKQCLCHRCGCVQCLICLLQFEWAWQHPQKSRRLGKEIAKKKSKESAFQHRFRVLAEMLSVGPWWRLPLTIRWLKPEYELSFPLKKEPPIHMPIAYGPVDICKLRRIGEVGEEEGRGEEEGEKRKTDRVVSACSLCSEVGYVCFHALVLACSLIICQGTMP